MSTPHRGAVQAPALAGAILVGLLLALGGVGPAYPQGLGAGDAAAPEVETPAQDQRQRLEQVQAEKDQMRRRLAGFKLSEQEAREQIEQLSAQVQASRKRKRELETDLALAQTSAADQGSELSDLRLRMEASRARIGIRVRRLYRFAKAERSATLFQLARTRSFARDAWLLGQLQQADLAALRQFETLNADLTRKQRDAQQSLERLRLLKADLDGERVKLQEREASLKASLSEVRHNQQLYAKYLSDLDQVQAGMQQALVSMEATRGDAAQALPEVAALHGHLAAPAPGSVVARFGQQDPRYQLKKFQRGVVIRVADESPVAAVAAGTVVYAGPFQGYQDLVVLNHGQGLFSVYGYLEHVTVAKGDSVERGRKLGNATFQPEDNAYDLYFELRREGKPEDPLAWLEPGALQGRPVKAAAGAAVPTGAAGAARAAGAAQTGSATP